MIFASLSFDTPGSSRKVLRTAIKVAGILVVWELLAFCAAGLLVVRVPLEHADAILVLSGSASYRERITRAAELYKRGTAPKILLTNDNQQGGWSHKEQRNPYFFEQAYMELVELGVPADAIVVLRHPVSSTHDEAELLASYRKQTEIRSLVIITSDYHSRRALWTFRRVFGNGQVVGLEPVRAAGASPATWWLQIRGWKSIPAEYAKLVYYRLRY